MGLFDYVRCDYALPGNVGEDSTRIIFQTKDLDCAMATYVISDDGRLLLGADGVEFVDYFTEATGGPVVSLLPQDWFSGRLELHWSNIVASGPGIYTRQGEDAHYLTYELMFQDGRACTACELENKFVPALPSSGVWLPVQTEEDRQRELERRQESLVGRTLYVWWGPHRVSDKRTNGYYATVLSENDRELIVQETSESTRTTLYRSSRDTIFFDSRQDAERMDDEANARWDARLKEYEDYVASRCLIRDA